MSPQASGAEIKAAYRALVKRHHPDAGGDPTTILALNAAWEVLGDRDRRRRHDRRHGPTSATPEAGDCPRPAATAKPATPARPADQEAAVRQWLRQVFLPIDRQLGQVISPFPAQLRALADDPYDDRLMEAFCAFLELSQARLTRVETLYRSQVCPQGLEGLSLDLYHCLSLVQDALADLERYTMGYVDSYLRDGREMLRKASKRRRQLQENRRRVMA